MRGLKEEGGEDGKKIDKKNEVVLKMIVNVYIDILSYTKIIVIH